MIHKEFMNMALQVYRICEHARYIEMCSISVWRCQQVLQPLLTSNYLDILVRKPSFMAIKGHTTRLLHASKL